MIEQLKKLEDLVYEREESFLKRFVANEDLLFGLTGIWFSPNNIQINFILYDGRHISDQISWEDFNNWLENKQ